ncbi:hypothetical protein K488DRAFT_83139 [Vararia minispora EC-137]|uniref:Uncharacterized protein n=1 Tax=Vararia minispora EC-137 TaxID=1314806 RepID=A0ACB8QUJ5_9AGAM|nr:hypothetical protein K488DRAFT_83139 [Vararia minispora EC-137]
MSRKAQVTLAVSILATTAIVWGVHYQQRREREVMYQGVIRDDERRREKMRQREEDLRISKAKREIYERVQKVQPSIPNSDSDDSG